MALQHAENLFRRYRGQLVTVKTLSGGVYEGRVAEVTNDFVELITGKSAHLFLLFQAIESMVVQENATDS